MYVAVFYPKTKTYEMLIFILFPINFLKLRGKNWLSLF